MDGQKDPLKEKKWQEYKAAVGTAVQMQKSGSSSWNLDDLLLNINDVHFDSLISQIDIVTEEDKKSLISRGYRCELTVDEFRERFDVDPSRIWYSPSISQSALYFDPETLAAAPFHLDFYLSGIGPKAEDFCKHVQQIESEVARHEYWGAILALPDAMQLEYFNLLVDKKGSEIPGLYELFFSVYTSSDYGFGGIKPETIKAVFAAKTEEDRSRTDSNLADLPDMVRIYRGGNSASVPYDRAYSWSLDANIATFFACRRGDQTGYIVEAEVNKGDIIDAFLEDRSEKEIIVAPEHVRVLQEMPMHGLDYLKDILPVVTPMYHKHLDRLMELDFAQDSMDHGYWYICRQSCFGTNT